MDIYDISRFISSLFEISQICQINKTNTPNKIYYFLLKDLLQKNNINKIKISVNYITEFEQIYTDDIYNGIYYIENIDNKKGICDFYLCKIINNKIKNVVVINLENNDDTQYPINYPIINLDITKYNCQKKSFVSASLDDNHTHIKKRHILYNIEDNIKIGILCNIPKKGLNVKIKHHSCYTMYEYFTIKDVLFFSIKRAMCIVLNEFFNQ